MIKLWNSKTSKLGTGVKLSFTITQDIRDIKLLENLIKHLDCGRLVVRPNVSVIEMEVSKFSDIFEKIIPFFTKYSIHGNKIKDFYDFEKAAILIENKAHLKENGLNEIKVIKLGMNRGRS